MFEKTLSDLVRGIRAHRGTEVGTSLLNLEGVLAGTWTMFDVLATCPVSCHYLFLFLWLDDGFHISSILDPAY